MIYSAQTARGLSEVRALKNKMSFKQLLSGILPGLAVAFAGCFMLFFYAPFELYITNHKEFWFTSG